MKLAVMITTIFNNLLVCKASFILRPIMTLTYWKTCLVCQSVATVNGSLPYPHASSKAPERCCLRYPPRIQMAPSISRGGSQQTQTLGPLQSASIRPHRTGTGQEWIPWDTPWSDITWRAIQVQARTPYTTSRPLVSIALSHTGNPPLSPIEAERRV
jgi:hypothetical protein